MPSPRPFTYRRGILHADDVCLAELAETFGTPLYVYSEAHVLERLKLFERAFAQVPHTVCYAVKANSSLALLRILEAAGAGFDIVSGGELARVAQAAKPGLQRTVFAGVGKQAWEIDEALKADVFLFNVESEGELELLARRAEAQGRPARFALRVNPDVRAETHPYISTGLSAHKFGIAIAEAARIYREASRSAWLLPTGVSVHIGSQIRDVSSFGDALERVARLVEALRSAGVALSHLDAGGGLGIEYGSAGFDPAAAVEAYAAQVLGATRGLGLHLLLEPGRFLVAQAGALLTRVLQVKRNGDKTFVITDAGMNDLIRPALYQAHHEVLPVEHTSRAALAVDVVGPVCESGDFFARERMLPRVENGELIAILDAGAYGMSLSSNYNTRVRPAEVLVQCSGGARLIRRRETLQDLFAPEVA